MTNETNGNAKPALTITAQHEAPQAIVTIIPDEDVVRELPELVPELPPERRPIPKKQISAEDAAEYMRLADRVMAEPTSFRARQELASFKSLKGIL